MKVQLAFTVAILIWVSLSCTSSLALEKAGTEGQNGSFAPYLDSLKDSTILKNEVLLERGATNYTEVRHIVLQGTNEEIGRAIAEISLKDYGAELDRYVDPVYARARLTYMQKNYPEFYQRMKGVAGAYNLSFENTDFDLTILPYDIGTQGCSVIYFPPSMTENGHAMACRNMDFDTVPLDVVAGVSTDLKQTGAFARTFVLELYPEEGYSSLVIGGHDLMGVFFQGINSEGLAVEMIEDYSPTIAMTPLSGARVSGMADYLAARMVLDTCKDIEEAKVALLNNRIYFPIEGNHFLIYDRYGNSTVAEFFAMDASVHFTDATDAVRVLTNHPLALYPTVDTFPEADVNATYYDTFSRYRTLINITESHRGKFSSEDMLEALALVYAEGTDQDIPNDWSKTVTIPARTTTNTLLDLTNGTISARFYLRDGPTDPVLGGPTNVFSQFFNFTLKKP